jgi:hypothetical protein
MSAVRRPDGKATGQNEGAESVSGALRAWAFALLALVVLTGVCLFVPHWLIVYFTALGRSARVWLATGWVAAAFAVVAFLTWRRSSAEQPADELPRENRTGDP